jgi:hypothetical protein
MQYTTCCVHSTAKLINDMTDKARQITYRTFKKYAEGLAEMADNMGYGPWLKLKDDWAVRFYKSTYNGRPCVYMAHSAIEYIWVGG